MLELTKEQVKDAIFVDTGAEVLYGQDQEFICYPHVFATVTIELCASDMLVEIADDIRRAEGFTPLRDSCDGWYNMYIGINDATKTKVDNSISFLPVYDGEDSEHVYSIPLSEEVQVETFKVLDEQLKQAFGKGCDEMLEEARKELA